MIFVTMSSEKLSIADYDGLHDNNDKKSTDRESDESF